mmetsp:Transcript_19926/g.32728  ORF Transcript_19926/g.32728 Transcript_19926/m.32728 type:complete len:256 (-) Transcript_19926:2010-2777(-)
MKREHARIHKMLRCSHIHVIESVHSMDTLIRVDIRTSAESNILHSGQSIQWQQCQVFRNGLRITISFSSLLLMTTHRRRCRIPRNTTGLISLLRRTDQINTRLLQFTTSIVQIGLGGNVQRLLRQQCRHGFGIHRINHFGRQRCHRNRLCYHTNASLSLTTRVQQCTLNRHEGTIQIVFIMGKIKCKHGIRIAIRQRQQVRSTNEEISIEVGNFHPPRTPDAHHTFKCRVLCQGTDQLALKPWSIRIVVESRIGP